MSDPAGRVTVTLENGETLYVYDRAAALIAFVAAKAAEVNADEFATLTFDSAGKRGRPKLQKTYPPVEW